MQIDVIVSHPAKQANIYHRPLAAQEAGLATKFLTGIYFGGETVTSAERSGIIPQYFTRLMGRRSEPGLLSSNVAVLPLSVVAECALRPAKLIPSWDRAHDFWASRWLQAKNPSAPAVVHGYQGSCARTLRVARKLGLTTLYEVMCAKPDAMDDSETSPGRVRLLEEIAFADCIVSLSAFSTDWLTSLGIPGSKILNVPMGVDTDRFSPGPSSTDPAFRVLFVGRVQQRKGVDLLFRAWNRLSLPNSELVVVGSAKDEDVSQLRQLAGETKVRFAGFIPHNELTEHYNAASVFVMPSHAEGDPNAVKEALSCGLPCVVTAAAQSVIRDGEEGVVVRAGDVDDLVSSLSLLYHDAALRREMGIRARRRALEFGWPAYRKNFGALYRNLLQGGDATGYGQHQGAQART